MIDELYHDEAVINSVFTQHGVAARVSTQPGACFQSSAFNVLRIDRAAGVKVSQVLRLADEIDEALTDMRSTAIQCRFESLPLRVLTPRRHPQTLDVLDVLARHKDAVRGRGKLQMLVGEVVKANSAGPLLVDMAQPTTPHMLVAGTTGSGKTTALIDLVLSLSVLNETRNLSIRVLDPKGVDLHVLDGLPTMEYAAIRDAATCVDALRATVADMDKRKRKGIADPDHRIVVVIDEMADLIAVAGDEVTHHLERILQAGRGLGVHVIGATQKPLSAIVGSLAKANFPLRLVGRVMSRNDANVAAGISDTGAERLPGMGAFVKVSARGVESVQAYAADKWRAQAAQRHGASKPVYVQRRQNDANLAGLSQTTGQTTVQTAVETSLPTSETTDKLPYQMPTPQDARTIRHFYKTLGSKNKVKAFLWPNRDKVTCLKIINAALGQQEVSA